MRETSLFTALKVLSYFVLFFMLVAAGYAFIISMIHWSGIAV
jgi:hypothetical protein